MDLIWIDVYIEEMWYNFTDMCICTFNLINETNFYEKSTFLSWDVNELSIHVISKMRYVNNIGDLTLYFINCVQGNILNNY